MYSVYQNDILDSSPYLTFVSENNLDRHHQLAMVLSFLEEHHSLFLSCVLGWFSSILLASSGRKAKLVECSSSTDNLASNIRWDSFRHG